MSAHQEHTHTVEHATVVCRAFSTIAMVAPCQTTYQIRPKCSEIGLPALNTTHPLAEHLPYYFINSHMQASYNGRDESTDIERRPPLLRLLFPAHVSSFRLVLGGTLSASETNLRQETQETGFRRKRFNGSIHMLPLKLYPPRTRFGRFGHLVDNARQENTRCVLVEETC